jgi:hypothetical protein
MDQSVSSPTPSFWRKCSSCKSKIQFGQNFWVCNVSTCNRKRTGLIFCKVACWDAHNPIMNHRDSWAEERKAPTKDAWIQAKNSGTLEKNTANSVSPARNEENEILVVASKIKEYIKEASYGVMNCSADVMPVLSDFVRQEAKKAIDKARAAERKTVLDRDF